METYYKCEKCKKENLINLYDDGVFDYKHTGEKRVTMTHQCKCGGVTWLMLDIEWNKKEIKSWVIRRSIYQSEQRMCNVKFEPKQPKKVKDTMSNKVDELNSSGNLTDEQLLSAIWLGMVKLKFNAINRADIMYQIENTLEERIQKENDNIG